MLPVFLKHLLLGHTLAVLFFRLPDEVKPLLLLLLMALHDCCFFLLFFLQDLLDPRLVVSLELLLLPLCIIKPNRPFFRSLLHDVVSLGVVGGQLTLALACVCVVGSQSLHIVVIHGLLSNVCRGIVDVAAGGQLVCIRIHNVGISRLPLGLVGA